MQLFHWIVHSSYLILMELEFKALFLIILYEMIGSYNEESMKLLSLFKKANYSGVADSINEGVFKLFSAVKVKIGSFRYFNRKKVCNFC